MNLSQLKDADVLSQIKNLVGNERDLLTQILRHLREIEKRKLFSDLGYRSLFEYAVKELKYSEGQAGRRVQAMRLIKEMPELEKKVQTGALTLSHLSMAQNYFREKDKGAATSTSLPAKIEILNRIQNTSAREGEKILLALNPAQSLPAEKEKILSDTHIEVSFVVDESLGKALEEVRTLLGAKALKMNYAQLIQEMANLSIAALNAKKFGKKRSAVGVTPTPTSELDIKSRLDNSGEPNQRKHVNHKQSLAKNLNTDPQSSRYISQRIKYQVWTRDRGTCTSCGSRSNLNIDHIHPKALGGTDSVGNLRLLCFHCNQRRAIKTFGARDRYAIRP